LEDIKEEEESDERIDERRDKESKVVVFSTSLLETRKIDRPRNRDESILSVEVDSRASLLADSI